MKLRRENYEQREKIIAALLWYGTLLASGIIAAGITLNAFQPLEGQLLFDLNGQSFVKAGVALFILLPVARVCLMLIIFLRDRDYVYSAFAMLVLLVISTGVVLGL